jgi:hypothetical protein
MEHFERAVNDSHHLLSMGQDMVAVMDDRRTQERGGIENREYHHVKLCVDGEFVVEQVTCNSKEAQSYIDPHLPEFVIFLG